MLEQDEDQKIRLEYAGNGMDDGSEDQKIPDAVESGNGLRGFVALGEFLQEDGWYPARVTDRLAYRTFFSGKNGELRCYTRVRPDMEQVIFYAISPVRVPPEKRLAAAEFITRANYGLPMGNFEMDMEDGEVRFKSSLDFEGEILGPNLLRNLIYPAVQTLDLYLPGLLQLIYGEVTPLEAIAAIEEKD